jgi:hypothetical protein
MIRYLLLFLLLCLLPLSSHAAVTVTTVAQLQNAVSNANSGGDNTILVADGTYNLDGVYLRITRDGVTVRSQSGNRSAVILDGNYVTTEIFQIVASHVTIADLTLKRAQDHPIHVMGGSGQDVNYATLTNLHIIDPGEQAIKINPSSSDYNANYGSVTDSLIELTSQGRTYVENDTSNSHPCYTGGIDGHTATSWHIADNVIQGFWCSTGLSEHGVHFWSDSVDTLVERNQIIDCDRGIGFGLGDRGHLRGIIRNNMIYHPAGHGYSDVGIGLESAENASVYNNTIYLEHDYPNAIEYRFDDSRDCFIANNLCNRAITSREGGTTSSEPNNITGSQSSWFVDTANGDLHLAAARSDVTDAGSAISDLTDDFDGDTRPQGGGVDIGADEMVGGFVPSPGVKQGDPLIWTLLLLQ